MTDATDNDDQLPTPPPSLRGKALAFAHEYLKDLNARQAAIRAGYSDKTNNKPGQLLAREDVQDYIAQIQGMQLERANLDAEAILRGLETIATYDLGELIGPDGKPLAVHDLPEALRRALQGIKFQKIYTETQVIERRRDQPDVVVETIQHVTTQVVEVKMPDRLRAFQLLGEHRKLWTPDKEPPKETAQLIIEGR